MSTINIRKDNLNDLETLLRFEQGVIESERPFDSTLKDPPVTYYDIKKLIEDEDSEIFVAESNGIIVGSGYARILESKSWCKYVKYAYLGFMYVEISHRGQGINQKILDALKQWTIDKNITELRLEVYYGNESAIRAYEKAGFEKLMVEMRLNTNDANKR